MEEVEKEVSKKKCFSFNEFMRTRNWKNFGIMGAVVLVGACILCANVPQVKVVSEVSYLARKSHASVAVQLMGETKFFNDAEFYQDSRNVYVKTAGDNWKKTEIFRNECIVSLTVIDGDGVKDAYDSSHSIPKEPPMFRKARMDKPDFKDKIDDFMKKHPEVKRELPDKE